jgi:hypothetical protein
VLIAIACHRNSKTGLCCPSLKRIGELAGLDERTVRRATAALHKLGILKWERGWGNQHADGTPNRYTLNLSAMYAHAYKEAADTDVLCLNDEVEDTHAEAQDTGDQSRLSHRTKMTEPEDTSVHLTVKTTEKKDQNLTVKTTEAAENLGLGLSVFPDSDQTDRLPLEVSDALLAAGEDLSVYGWRDGKVYRRSL